MFVPAMINVRLIFSSSLLLVVLLSATAVSSAWAQIAVDASCTPVCGQELPLSPDEGDDEPLQPFEEEREQERDGGEEGSIAKVPMDIPFIVRQSSRILTSRAIQSLPCGVFKVPII